ncbi:iron chelate uptake ABC transporter family permease subunit [Paracoccus sp. S-4012]|uniref:FecCD family ABC transporter permease n=1 Tax=Paracoccus sp. S-4012 TaxID=2665648 RepID=UPI0012B0DD90|nr:iron ABC transporter permease [Paracoccus sp. S-4012]MRX51389.1 iron chelate uptake ABC transporter family permease subunit [Paracoccus sp. S-4012]
MTRLAAALIVLVAALFSASLVTGPASIGAAEGLRALILGGDGPVPMVMREIRLPRAILGATIGAGLGLAGAALQGYLRNPLAEPGLIGVTGTATLGAVLAIHGGLSALTPLATPAAALIGAGLGVALLMSLAAGQGGALMLILAGIALAQLAAALSALVLNLSPNPYAAQEIVFWMMGSLADRSMLHVALALPAMAVGWVLLLTTGRALDALTLGEDAAAGMGVNLARLRWQIVLGTAAAVGGGAAVAGGIGFVGLVVPHLLRPLTGARPAALLWSSALGGAALLLAADIAVRVTFPERDLKLGVVTALIGVPLFLHMLARARREGGP